MTDSLSNVLNFKINNYPVILGRPLDVAGLQSSGINKVGFFAQLLLPKEKGEELFVAQNSVLTYLDGEDRVVAPVVDAKNKKKTRFGTIAYFSYQNNRLSKFGFQIIQSTGFVGFTLFEEIEKRIANALIPPASSPARNQRVWKMNDQKLVLTLPRHEKYGYIHLMYNE